MPPSSFAQSSTRPFTRLAAALTLTTATLFAPSALLAENSSGETIQALSAQLQAMQQQISQLQGKIRALESKEVTAATAAPTNIASSPASRSRSPQFNPDIGVVADIVGKSTQSDEDAEGNDRLSVRHVEFVFGHDVDPYSRLDVIATFSDYEDPALEVAQISYWGLPYDSKLRIGRIRPQITKAANLHRDQLETVDEPFVIARYLGEEGLSRTGAEISNFLPTPWESPSHELAFGILEGGVGHEAELLGENSRAPSFYARLKNGFDLSDETRFDLGGSFMMGSADADTAAEVRLFAVDTTVEHHFNAVQRLKFQAEALFQDRSAPFVEEHSDDHEAEAHDAEHTEESGVEPEGLESPSFRANPWGTYALLDFRAAERWSLGTRFDYAQPVNYPELASRRADTAWNGYLTFHQSEFARWRIQYQRALFAEGGEDNRFFLQGTFAIGVHKHQIQ